MTTPFTISSILKSPCAARNPQLQTEVKKKVVKARNDCPQVIWIHWQLKYFCEERGLTFEKEFQFDKKEKIKRPRRKKGEPKPPKEPRARQYRFDFAVIGYNFKAGFEYHGLTKEKSGHTTNKGFTSDTEKMNLAISEGWKVYCYTYLTYQNVLTDLKTLIENI